jgi:hypothetical protein
VLLYVMLTGVRPYGRQATSAREAALSAPSTWTMRQPNISNRGWAEACHGGKPSNRHRPPQKPAVTTSFPIAAIGTLALLSAAQAGAANLNHHYNFSAGVIDLAGFQNGTLQGGANVIGGTLNLSGSGQYAEFLTSIVPTAGSYSVALWAKGNAAPTGYTELISQGSSGGPGFYIGTDGSGTLMRAGDSWTVTGVPFGASGVWTHYALVVNAGANTTQLFVNGSLAALLPQAIGSAAGGSPTRLGRQFDPAAEYFNGSIDEVRTYDGVLSFQEVQALAAVPEPGGAAMWLVGVAGLAGLARRRMAGIQAGGARP